MTHHTSDVATGAFTAAGMLIKTIGQAIPHDWAWINDLGVPGCMAIAIFLLLKDRAAILKDLKESRDAHAKEMESARGKYEAKLQEIADKAEKRADGCAAQNN